MNILILNWRDTKHPLTGGAEAMLLEHAKAWIKDGHEVTWFASSAKGLLAEEVIEGIKFYRKGNHLTVFFWAFVYYLNGVFRSTQIVIDCFHFLPFFTPLYIRSKPIVGLIHEVAGKVWFENLFYPFALIGYFLEPYIIRLYKHKSFITVSKSTEEELIQIGISKKNITVIENGTNPSTYENKVHKKDVLIFLGRISDDKGVMDAIKSFSLIVQKYPTYQLWIVGKSESEPHLEKIKKEAEKLGISSHCKFWGYVSEKQKYKLLSESKLLLHPSRKEGWGLNVIEANIVGTPAVGYDVAGLRDSIIDGKTGILVDENYESLAMGVEELLKNEKNYKVYSGRAIKWAQNFSWDKSTKKSIQLLRSLA